MRQRYVFVLLALGIPASAPVMRPVLNGLRESLGPSGLSLAAWALVIGGAVGAVVMTARGGAERALRLFVPVGLLLVTAGFIPRPEEKIHLIEYGLLGYLAWHGLWRRPRWLPVAAVVLSVGVADELIQWFLPDRVGDLRDVAMNACGGVVGIYLGMVSTRGEAENRA